MDEQPKPGRKRTKKSAESASPAQHKESQHKEQKTGGLAVVVVILIAIMVIVAIFFAAQNKKTRGLENEVISLKDKIEGKLTDITAKLDEQKEEQAKVDEKIEAKVKLAKVYKSSLTGFSVNYPISFIPEKNPVKLDKTYKESYAIVRESDIPKYAGVEDGGPTRIIFDVYEVPADKDLVTWVSENVGAPYSTNYSEQYVQKNEDGTLKAETKKIGDFEYFTYQWTGLLTGDEYFMRKDNFIIRISAVYMDQADTVQQEIVSILETLKF